VDAEDYVEIATRYWRASGDTDYDNGPATNPEWRGLTHEIQAVSRHADLSGTVDLLTALADNVSTPLQLTFLGAGIIEDAIVVRGPDLVAALRARADTSESLRKALKACRIDDALEAFVARSDS
jgi:hypothetical protein